MSADGLQGEVEARLEWGSVLRFPSHLAALYEERHGAERRSRLSVALWASCAALAVSTVFEWMNLRHDFALALALRCTQCLLALAAALLIGRLRPGWQERATFGVPVVAMVLLNCVIGERAPAPYADRYFLATVGALAALCAVPPVPVAAAGAIAACGLACMVAVLAFVPGSVTWQGNLDIVVFGMGALALAMLVGVRNEAARRRAFLHTLRQELTARELVRMNAELVRLTYTDALTGIDNRRKFEADLSGAWSGHAREGLGVLIIDVDHFKQFNDAAGHAAGDACLRCVAQAIAASVRSGELHVARYGGEEFAVLAVRIARPALLALGERIRMAVEALGTPHPGRPGQAVTISIGAAWCEGGVPFATQDDLLRAADTALYAAKLSGRNRLVADGDRPRLEALLN